jgi:hypothetical protein
MFTKECPVCHAAFVANDNRKKYCTHACFAKDLSIRTKGKPHKVVKNAKCSECGKELSREQTLSGNKYCSLICTASAWRVDRKCICKQCGKEYTPKTKDRTTFCSRECCFANKAESSQYAHNREAYLIRRREVEGEKRRRRSEELRPLREAKANESKAKQELAKQRREEKQKLKERQRIRNCIICGMRYIAKNYNQLCCSRECSKKHTNHITEVNRRHKIRENGKIDYNISLNGLIKRDKNVCHICGGRCNIHDAVTDERGNFIVGEDYPTIDHVMPVSKGGTHTWNNIKLAHKRCNESKSDARLYEKAGGQIAFSI